MQIEEIKNSRDKTENVLILYHHPYSYYSQKVLMALHEKQIAFKEYVINLIKHEQYEEWFLDLNPKGEFPVLDASGIIIPSSSKILTYLEDHYQFDESIPQLIPIDVDIKTQQKVTYFRYNLDQIQSGIITLGSFYHEEYVGRPKIPFIKPVRHAMKNAENNRVAFLTEQIEYTPRYRHVFQQKINNSQRRHEIITSKDEFFQQLELVENVLDKIEEELAAHTTTFSEEVWLCCERFTVADISLTVLLERLNVLGLEDHFWGNGKRPNVEDYYKRVQKRPSYRKTMPDIKIHLRLITQGHQSCAIAGGCVLAGFVVLGSFLLLKKLFQ